MSYISPTTRYGYTGPYGAHPRPQAAPVSTGGKPQPVSGSRRVTVKSHTRTLPPKPKAQKPRGGSPVSSSDAALLQAATRLRFAPQEQAYQQQLNQNAAYSAGLPSWYQNALSEIRGLQSQGQATSAQTLGQIQNYNSQPVLQNPTDQQAAQARNNLNTEFAASFGQQANANSAFMDRLAAANATGQANAQLGASRDRQTLLAGQTALKGQEGDFATTYGAQLQAAKAKADIANRDYALKVAIAQNANLLKQGTLGVQTKLANSLTSHRTAQEKTARSGVRLRGQSQAETKQQHAVTNADRANELAQKAYKLAHPNAGKPAKPRFTPVQQQKSTTDFNRAQALIQQVYSGKKIDPAKVADQLATSKHAVPHDLALAAAQLIKNQGLGVRGIDDPRLAKRIRKLYGIKVPVVKQSPQIGNVVNKVLGAIP